MSADSSGAHLHRRGYRTAVTPAPMRETLAAALVLASGWDLAAPLIDPFCGSGTIPIEAAMLAAHFAPGRNRSFRFMNWPDFDAAAWRRILRAAREGETAAPAMIIGTDRSGTAIRAATDNAARAGATPFIRFEQRDALDSVAIPAPAGWIITNPPYGVRLGDAASQRRLLTGLGSLLRSRFPGWHVGILTTIDRAGARMGIPLEERLRTTNGGLRVHYLTGVVGGPAAPRRAEDRVGKSRRAR